MTVSNNKGQALIESILVTFGLILITSGLLLGTYTFLVIEWTDFWVYRSTICLAEGQGRFLCQRQLSEKIKVLFPTRYFSVTEIWKTPKQASSKIELDLFFLKTKKMIQCQINLPLPTH